MTLRTQVLLAIVVLLLLGVGATFVVLTWNIRESLLREAENSGVALAEALVSSVSVLQEMPREVERVVGDQMVVQSRIAAEFVAAAEKGGMTTAEINERLTFIANQSQIDEFWISDETGAAYLTNIPVEFAFDPDPEVQPQAYVFWPLITGEATEVIQQARIREIDDQVYKYAAVAGIDQPRIVQVGNQFAWILDIRRRTGFQAALDGIVASSGVEAMWLLDANFDLVASRGQAGEEMLLQPFQKEAARRTVQAGVAQSHFFEPAAGYGEGKTIVAEGLDVYVPHISQQGELQFVAVIRTSTERIRETLLRSVEGALVVAGVISLLGILISLFLSQRITQPVRVIGAAAEAVEGGSRPSEDLEEVARKGGELGHLAEVFGDMAEVVRLREERLDQLVRERTLELEESHQDLRKAYAVMNDDLEMAKALQQAMVVRQTPEHEGGRFEIHGFMKTARQLGGDFYEVFQLSPTRTAFGIADVSGKGTAAALFMAVSKMLLEKAIRQAGETNLGEAATIANRELCAQNLMGYFVTVFAAIFDSETGRLHFVNGGHEAPYVVHPDGTVVRLETQGGMALGVFEDAEFQEGSIDLGVGDRLFLFTDGFTEAMSPEGEWFGQERLEAALRSRGGPEATGPRFIHEIVEEVNTFVKGAEQSDDITCVAARYAGDHGPAVS